MAAAVAEGRVNAAAAVADDDDDDDDDDKDEDDDDDDVVVGGGNSSVSAAVWCANHPVDAASSASRKDSRERAGVNVCKCV
jgi:hypothetical protein